MRIVVARRIGRRGAGLGNELIPWAKGFIASQVLDAKLFGPAWGLNQRNYHRNFGTSRLDVVREEMLRRLPNFRFTEEDYNETGETDFGRSIEKWAKARGLMGKKSFIVVIEGMYGGLPAYRSARSFIMAKLLNSKDALENVFDIQSRLDPRKLFVAVHMRSGDFNALNENEDVRGKFNFRIPPAWYLRVCESLHRSLGDQIQFHFFTDTGGPEYDEAVRRFNPGQRKQKGLTECSDLLLLIQADLRICSVSSYSVVSCFMSDGLYVWYEPQLIHDDSMYTPWSDKTGNTLRDMQVKQHRHTMEATPVAGMQEMIPGWPAGKDGVVPEGLLALLRRRLLMKSGAGNFQEYGAVPDIALQFGEDKFPASAGSQ